MSQTSRSTMPLLIMIWSAAAFFLSLEIMQLLRPADFMFDNGLSGLLNPLMLAVITLLVLIGTHLHGGSKNLHRIFVISAAAVSITCLLLLATEFKLSWWFVTVAFHIFWLNCFAGLWLFNRGLKKLLAGWFSIQGLTLLYLYLDRKFYLVTKVHLSLLHIWRLQNTAIETTGLTLQNTLPVAIDIAAFLAISMITGLAMARPCRKSRGVSFVAIAVMLQLVCMIGMLDHIIQTRPFVEYLMARFDASGLSLPLPASLLPLRENGLEVSSFKLDPEQFYTNASFTWTTSARRNIIFLTLESVRAADIEQNMPLLMKWAKRGIYFANHYAASNITETSLNSIYGSMYPFFLTEMFHKIKPWSFIDFLQADGYKMFRAYCKWSGLYNEAFYKNFTMLPVPEPTVADPLLRELPLEWFVEVSDYQLEKLGTSSGDVLAKVMQAATDSERFFIEGYLFNGHFNYSYPPEFAVNQPTLPDRFMIHDLEPSPENLLKLKNRYRNAMGYLDFQIDRFLGGIFDKGLLKNTVVVIYGDHGQSLGESGFFAHVSGPHIYQFQVPCLIIGPGIEPQRFDGISQNLDLLPTLGKMLGYTASGTFGRNLFKEERQFSLEQENSVQNRFIVRRPHFMSIYEVQPDRRVRWALTIGNHFELNPRIMALYTQPGLTDLQKIIAEDYRQIAFESRVNSSE